jgi:pyruvate carboxylase subunit B
MNLSVPIGGRTFRVEVAPEGRGFVLKVDGSGFRATVEPSGGGYHVLIGPRGHEVWVEGDRVVVDGRPLEVSVEGLFGGHEETAQGASSVGPAGSPSLPGIIYPPMPGRVIAVSVRAGDFVRVGTPLLVLEAMKMQNEIPSPREGRVKEVRVTPGQSVGPGDALVILE